jgi:hypothetical protein
VSAPNPRGDSPWTCPGSIHSPDRSVGGRSEALPPDQSRELDLIESGAPEGPNYRPAHATWLDRSSVRLEFCRQARASLPHPGDRAGSVTGARAGVEAHAAPSGRCRAPHEGGRRGRRLRAASSRGAAREWSMSAPLELQPRTGVLGTRSSCCSFRFSRASIALCTIEAGQRKSLVRIV